MAKIFIFLTLCAVNLISPFAGPASAQLPAAEVEFEYVFGDQIVFRVEVETEQTIKEAWLFLRRPGDSHPIYGELVAVQDHEGVVVLEYVQDLAIEPLPAFASVEYWADIRLDSGELISTGQESFLYMDNTKEWQFLEEEPFRVFWFEGEMDRSLDILGIAREGLDEARNIAALEIPDLVDIYVYPDAGTLAQMLRTENDPLIAAHAHPESNVILAALPVSPESERLIRQRIPHELMHILLYHSTGSGHENIPQWLNEGLSSIVEQYPNPDYEVLVNDAHQADGLFEIETLCSGFPTDTTGALLAYAQSASFTRYLYQRFGKSGIEALVENYADGKSCQFAVESALGTSLTELEAQWRQDILGESPPGTPLENLLPWIVLVGAILIIPLAITIGKLRKNRK